MKNKSLIKGRQLPSNRSENMGHAVKVPSAKGCSKKKG